MTRQQHTEEPLYAKGKHYALDLERAILGAIMLEQTAFARVMNLLTPECFYHDAHRELYRVMSRMYRVNIPIDMLTVRDQIERVENNSLLGGDSAYFIAKITMDVVSSAHLEYHAYIVKQMWITREIMRLTSQGTNDAATAGDQIAHLRNELDNLVTKSTPDEWEDMTTLMVKLYQHQEEMKKSGGIGLSCGIRELDRSNGGFFPGNMIVVGARPGVGKSAFAAMMALHMAMLKKTVGIISLEMNNTEIAGRLAALHTETDFAVLYRGLYRDEMQTHRVYEKIARDMPSMGIYVSDATGVDAIQIRAKASKLKAQVGKLDCLMIDYLQLISAQQTGNKTRENQIQEISRSCKIMAKELNIPVVLLCQLNREPDRRKGEARYPQLSDLRESGSIEQDADIVMFLHSDFLSGIKTDDEGSTEKKRDLLVRKWRNGVSNFGMKMMFEGKQMRFYIPGESIGYRPERLKDFTQSNREQQLPLPPDEPVDDLPF